MKKLIWAMFLAIFAVAFTAGEVSAQKDKDKTSKGGGKGKGKGGDKKDMTPEERATNATDRMTKRYALNATQGQAIKAINLQFATDMKALKAKGKEGKDERKARRQKHVSDIKAQLTAEQATKFDADLEAAKKRRAERRAANGKGGGKGKGKGGKPEGKGKPEDIDVHEDLGDEGDDD